MGLLSFNYKDLNLAPKWRLLSFQVYQLQAFFCIKTSGSPGQSAQLFRASSQFTKVEGSIPVQGTYRKQPMNAWMGGKTKQCSLSKNQSIKKKEYIKI